MSILSILTVLLGSGTWFVRRCKNHLLRIITTRRFVLIVAFISILLPSDLRFSESAIDLNG